MLNVKCTLELLRSLGFIVHPTKSVLLPIQCITYLGFNINSATMTVILTDSRKESIKAMAVQLRGENKTIIRVLARFIGLCVASFPADMWGPLYYRNMEKGRKLALVNSRGNFDAEVDSSEESVKEIGWWLSNVDTAYNNID